MIPLVAIIRISQHKESRLSGRRRRDVPRSLRLWIPLFLIWLLLLPLVLVLLPLAMLALLVVRINPFRAFAAFWQTLTGLTGTHIEVNGPDALVYVRIL
jgi:hypothetical protein